MVSLARASLLYEWRRYLAAVLAVAFSGLLVLVQLALLIGMFGTVAVYIDESSADLWVGFTGTQSIDLGKPVNGQIETRLRDHPKVVSVEPFIFAQSDWRTPEGRNLYAYLLGIDPDSDGMAFAKVLKPSERAALLEPMAVIIDASDREKLGVDLGSRAEMGGRTVKVVAVVEGLRAIGGVNVLTSVRSARIIDGSIARDIQEVSYFLLGLAPGADAETVRAEVTPSGPVVRYQVWTAREFSHHSQLYWLTESGAGAGFAFSTLLGLLVGIIITSQTLMGAIIASIREYATLRALGISQGSLAAVVIEQSLWIGMIGLTITAVCAWAVGAVAHHLRVAMEFPAWAIWITVGITLSVAVLSGLAALRALGRADPAALLR